MSHFAVTEEETRFDTAIFLIIIQLHGKPKEKQEEEMPGRGRAT